MKRLYEIVLDDGQNLSRQFVPAENEQDAKNYVHGNGEVLRVRDLTKDHIVDLDDLRRTLSQTYVDSMVDLVVRIIEQDYSHCL